MVIDSCWLKVGTRIEVKLVEEGLAGAMYAAVVLDLKQASKKGWNAGQAYVRFEAFYDEEVVPCPCPMLPYTWLREIGKSPATRPDSERPTRRGRQFCAPARPSIYLQGHI
eukprot:6177326-Pleurochrysis_carterae.AAC.1